MKGVPDRVEVGFPEGTGEVLDRAFYNEFGTEHIPERPFMRLALKKGGPALTNALEVGGVGIIRAAANGQDVVGAKRRALGVIGIEAQGLIQESITSLSSPPNAASTIRQKGSSNPLIETGQMRQSVTWRVKK